MTVSPLIWSITVVVIVGLVLFDYFFHVRKAHVPTLREAAVWSAIYVGIALVFGAVVWLFGGPTMGTEYFAGYITEKALSVDNLFVFLVIITSFRVPREDQQKVLLFGITFAIIARTAMILGGAAILEYFSWAFYAFGLILFVTAVNMLRPESGDEADNLFIRIARRLLPASDVYDGDKLFTRIDGRRVMTPMLLVMVAIGATDILFALDSIPAIFGLTQNVFIVFTATVFSLLGLRQLYFLIDGLLDRLVYLSFGLATILAFIGVKLVLHALHENDLFFINGGDPVPVPEVSTELSLLVIVGVLTITVVASLISPKGKAKAALAHARKEAASYVEMTYAAFETRRDALYARMEQHEQTLDALPEKYSDLLEDEKALPDLLADAHALHEQRTGDLAAGRRSDDQPDGLRCALPDGTLRRTADGTITTAEAQARAEAEEAERRGASSSAG